MSSIGLRLRVGIIACAVSAASLLTAQTKPAVPAAARQHFENGNHLRLRHHWRDALNECVLAGNMAPGYVDAIVCEGRTLGQQGKWDAATAAFTKALTLDPANAPAHNSMGWVYAHKFEVDKAVAEFRQALKSKPDYPGAHMNLWWALSQLGDNKGSIAEGTEARNLYVAAAKANPKSPETHEDLADAYAQFGFTEAALKEYHEALRLDPEYGDANNSIADILAARHDFEDASTSYREAIRLEPEDAEPHSGLAWVLLQQRTFTLAKAEADAAILLRPDLAMGHIVRGSVLEREGDRKGALEQYRLALEASPKDESIRSTYNRLRSESQLLPANWSASTVHAVTLTFALVPSFLLFGYFRGRDLYPEPARVLWATFALGIAIIWPVLWTDGVLAHIVDQYQGTISHAAAEALFNAALPEEFWKLMVVMLYCARNKEFDEPMDGIVYGAVASLGFATYENYMYVSNYGIGVAIGRAVLSVPGHAFMGAVMGYFVGQWRFGSPSRKGLNLILAYVAPVSLHWMYDFPLIADRAAWHLSGQARELALTQLRPLYYAPELVFALEAVLAVWLVQRMRQQQIQMTVDAAVTAAAAEGGNDVAAFIKSSQPKPAKLGWVLTIAGGIVTLLGGALAIAMSMLMHEDWANMTRMDFLTGSLIGAVPLILGLLLFVVGVRKVHAVRHATPRLPLAPRSAAATA